ncbi:phosphatidylserine decarboxylase [Patescibacteria group bacterium]|nr:phosphatidylserine decarboxylase [Patescibacteria group bacterium]
MLKLLIPLLGGYLYTQRNPIRIPDSEYGMLSPADGVIVSIDNDILTNNRIVKIFLGLFDVHHQRAPLSGIVKSVDLYNGDTGFCYPETGCPEYNKFILTIIETEYGDIEIIQKAGGIFSIPISFLTVGQYVEKGETIGKITFGSGCSTTIPSNFNIIVEEGQKVYAGQTIIAT